jgi:hypothetical protein
MVLNEYTPQMGDLRFSLPTKSFIIIRLVRACGHKQHIVSIGSNELIPPRDWHNHYLAYTMHSVFYIYCNYYNCTFSILMMFYLFHIIVVS